MTYTTANLEVPADLHAQLQAIMQKIEPHRISDGEIDMHGLSIVLEPPPPPPPEPPRIVIDIERWRKMLSYHIETAFRVQMLLRNQVDSHAVLTSIWERIRERLDFLLRQEVTRYGASLEAGQLCRSIVSDIMADASTLVHIENGPMLLNAQVICDASNNASVTLDANELNMDIFIASMSHAVLRVTASSRRRD